MVKIVAIVAALGLTLVVAAAFAYSAFYAGPKHTKVETRSFPASVRTITIRTDAGDVDLVRGERLVVRETHHYRGDRRPNVERRVSSDGLTIEDHGCKGFALGGGCTTDFRVEVPVGLAVRIESDAGDVRATGLDASELALETDAGDVHATAFASPTVRASTDAGDVRLDLVRAPRVIDAETDAGDVTIAVPPGSYAVTTETDAGDDDVRGIVNDPNAPSRISARTDAGDVEIKAR
jgi:Putative adhesin